VLGTYEILIHTHFSWQTKHFSYSEFDAAAAAPAVHAITGAENSTAAKQEPPENPTGTEQNPPGNSKASLPKHNSTLSKWNLPESCIILQVHRAGQPVWVLLDSKAHCWLRKSGVL